jgi:hypothetical protein
LFVDRAGDLHQIATRDTGGIKEVPDQFIVLKAGHHIEDFTATRTDVYWAKGSQVCPKGTWYALLVFQQAE